MTPETSAPKIFAAISAVMAQIGPVAKDRKNTQQNYSFRGVDETMNAFSAVMAEHGIFPIMHRIDPVEWNEVTSKSGGMGYHTVRLYTFRLYASDGSFVEGQTEGQAIDYGDKSITKAQSVAYREFLLKTFVVPFQSAPDADIENASHDLRPRKAAMPPPPKPAPLPAFTEALHGKLLAEIASGDVNAENLDEVKVDLFRRYELSPEMVTQLRTTFAAVAPKKTAE